MSRETSPRFAGIGGHQSHKAGTVEWLTPPEIITALRPFDLDPCAPLAQPSPTAARTFTRRDNGLLQAWSGRVWLNPPYAHGVLEEWLARMAEHDHGTALIFARTETDAFFRYVWECSSALLFLRGRVNFLTPDGTPALRKDGKTPANAGAPSVLCAYGVQDADILAGCDIDGAFVPLRFPRSVFGATIDGVTWAQALAEFFAEREGPVSLPELYLAFSEHPKASTNQNFDAKLRQQLQRGPYRRVGHALWEAAR